MKTAFLIETDRIETEREGSVYTLRGSTEGDRPASGVHVHYPVRFKLYDDDNILYYTGRATGYDGAVAAFDWAQSYAGCTRVDTSHGGAAFTTLIG